MRPDTSMSRTFGGIEDGFKVNVDLGLYQFGKEASKNKLQVAKQFAWMDRQTRSVSVQILTLNGNVDVMVSVDLHFFFDVGGHVRTQRIVNTVRVGNLYSVTPKFRIWRVILEMYCFLANLNWAGTYVRGALCLLSVSLSLPHLP